MVERCDRTAEARDSSSLSSIGFMSSAKLFVRGDRLLSLSQVICPCDKLNATFNYVESLLIVFAIKKCDRSDPFNPL